MSGGSQHNPNGRQSQLGPGWSPLQLQVANFLARAPPVHMAPDRGVTWHTPTPPPHLYHVPAPSPPDPIQGMLQLQAMKAAGNSVFRHTATPPELYRHTPTPPDKHHLRHTPSPGDMKVGTALPPADIYPHLGPGRDKLVRAEELLAYARGGVDLSLSSGRGANGAGAGALSVRDAPTINSLIARAAPRPPHSRVDALLERLAPAPAPAPISPHSVIVHPRVQPTPSPPSSNEDSADSCSAPPGSKRKRKPERTLRVPSVLPPPAPSELRPPPAPATPPAPSSPRREPAPLPLVADPAPPPAFAPAPPPAPLENGLTSYAKSNGPEEQPPSPRPHARRKSRSGSAETIADIAAMIADTQGPAPAPLPLPTAVATVATLESVLASSDPEPAPLAVPTGPAPTPAPTEERREEPTSAPVAAAPRRRSARTSNSEATNVPVESPSEGKPAEPEASEVRSAEPTAASFVEVENQLEKMFAGLEEEAPRRPPVRKRRRSAPRRKPARPKPELPRLKRPTKEPALKDAYDSGSNASSSRSRGPYIQIRGPRDSPVSVTVMNACTGEEEGEGRRGEGWRSAPRRGLHASTLGLRYDAHTPDASWLCAFCQGPPHAHRLGDLFGPYTVHTDCEEYRALDEATRRRYLGSSEVWFHAECAVWAPGLVASGARVWGLAGAVWAARAERCAACHQAGAALACAARPCRARAHLPCAAAWRLQHDAFRALCPRHA